jgi:polynucleotide 5'-kinase involved in rRNA processing
MSSENSSPPATDEIRLLLIGPSKTGQSSIANILAGCNAFPVSASSSINSATPTTQSRHFTNKKILVGKHLLIVDAPVGRSTFTPPLSVDEHVCSSLSSS